MLALTLVFVGGNALGGSFSRRSNMLALTLVFVGGRKFFTKINHIGFKLICGHQLTVTLLYNTLILSFEEQKKVD